MFNFNSQEFSNHLQANSTSLLYKKISSDLLTPVLAFLKLKKHFTSNVFLFESVENDQKKGRFSIIGLMPDVVWKCQKQKSYVNANFTQDKQNFIEQNGNPISNLREIINSSRIKFDEFDYYYQKLPAMCTGLFGYMGYDMVKLMEKLPNNNLQDDLLIPDSIFIRPQIILVFDSFYDNLLICAPSYNIKDKYHDLENKILNIEKILESQIVNKNKKNTSKVKDFDFQASYSKEQFCNMVKKAKEYITAGDVFQVLPSQRFTSDFPNIDPFEFYRTLRAVNPSPFLFYLQFEDFVLTGSSPEIMVSKQQDKIVVRPLAGTKLRGKNYDEDQKIAKELLEDEKEIAEHLMLIDLARNDIGMVAKSGSINVTKKMAIEYYSHVMHISSCVEGKLSDQFDALDALISSFPAGTVSGAPKIRAMEIIEEIEKIKRSFYSGCVGYFAGNGDMETCITLRSALIKDHKIYLHSGAGVVFDSNVESEYQETLNKVQAFFKACQLLKNSLS
ncbi:anthranilate synthase component 1 [Alphaproteobacteria bacterium]|nr:anthranilate synthase component 1 [Alphaproteobacteria bacterium]